MWTIVPQSNAQVSASTDSPASSALFQEFIEAQDTGKQSTLPDYSYAGYHRSEKPLPSVSSATHRVFDVTVFGAIPDDGQSDRDAVLKVLEKAHQHDGPVLVLFPEGRFRLNEPSDLGKPPLAIKRSNLVVRGSGTSRTELFFAEPELLRQWSLTVQSDRPGDYYWRGGSKVAKLVSSVLDDPFSIEVEDASRLSPGMVVNIDADLDVNTQAGRAYFSPHEVPEGPRRGRSKKGVMDYVFELHQIQSISGNHITFREPIHIGLQHMTSVVLWAVEHTVQEVGIEELAILGNYRGQFKHHNGNRFGEDFRMLRFEDALNCWVRNVRIADYSFAINFWRSGFNTFMNLLFDGNAGHSLVTGEMSYGNLIAYAREFTDSHHGLGVRSSATNTVFLRCVQYAGMEAHCGWPRATLYDLNEGRFSTRGGGATFYPHHGKLLCFWNWDVSEALTLDFWPEGKRYGYFMPPIIAGLHGAPVEILDQDTDILANESPGTKVVPESLFEAQLAHRLGSTPEWLRAQSRLFEEVSRYSRLSIASPANHSVYPLGSSLSVEVRPDPRMRPEQIQKIEIEASRTGITKGFATVATAPRPSLQTTFEPDSAGVWVLRAVMTNTREEVSRSASVTIFVGESGDLKPRKVERITMLPQKEKMELYNQFVALGGGEGQLKDWPPTDLEEGTDQPWQIEAVYLKRLQELYRSYGQASLRPLLERPDLVNEAKTLMDGDPNTTGARLYGWMDTMVQLDLGSPQRVNRLDVHWRDKNQGRPVRLELQTTDDPDAWYSVVNDEPLWEFAVARVGGTLRREPLPGDRISTIYFPERHCRYVRLLLSGFANGRVAELVVLGP